MTENRRDGEVMLHYDGVDVGYGARSVVSGTTLAVAQGEVLGLVGPNGAGKSTLLKVVTGEAELRGGEVYVAGRALRGMDARDRARIVGVVPQHVTVTFAIPAREFVEMGRHPHLPRFGSRGGADDEVVSAALELTDTAALAHRPVDELSGGDLQRLALAQALAQEPSVLLLDEPTSHLDLNHRLQVLDLVRDLAGQGMAVLAVFHDLDLAARYADRIAVVSGGVLETAAVPEEVVTAEMLSRVFGVRAVVGPEPVTGAVSVVPVLREGAVKEGRGRVMVVGGSGAAAGLMRRFVLAGRSVAAGALNAGDADAVVATALGIDFPEIPAFAPMDDAALGRVRELAAGSDVVVVCDVPFGHGNIGNLEAAVKSGTPLVLIGSIEDRDFTGGRAEDLWREAVQSCARVVTGTAEAEAEVRGLFG